ncbi:MAG TPA: hypothetical protein VFA89_10845 [Terriglobales bacterium]|nr:hypothetical protein [Terriglobales bacterium]
MFVLFACAIMVCAQEVISERGVFPNSKSDIEDLAQFFVSPVAADLYPPYVWPHTERLSQRLPEPFEVVKLRRTAQHLASFMRNFSATEIFTWGHDDREPEVTDTYETLIVDGWQRWRGPGDQTFSEDIPAPLLNTSVTPGVLWSALPGMVATESSLKIHQARDATVGGRTVHVFQYAAYTEDMACRFWVIRALGDLRRSTSCHGEVWVDQSGIILRISETIDLSGALHRFRARVTYGRLVQGGTQYLVPITFETQVADTKTYWCRAVFTDYDMSGAKTRLTMPEQTEKARRPVLPARRFLRWLTP